MALALSVFLFLWKAYSRMERQVIALLFQNWGLLRADVVLGSDVE